MEYFLFILGGCYVGGKIGFNVEGIDLWSWSDASSYNSGDVWHSLAMKFERYDMDICRGHAANGVYHRKLLAVLWFTLLTIFFA